MTTNTQTNEHDERAELIRNLRKAETDLPFEGGRYCGTVAEFCGKAAALLEADAQRPAMRPLTDAQCDAIYMALDEWAREFDTYEFGLPHHCGGGMEGGRDVIRKAAHGITGEKA